ncbi:MAG TPA: sensor histidine kinase [Xanthobacteraceae bacterium]|nr:sensor histidine kinase [Xanthobacteraceae bacterium]
MAFLHGSTNEIIVARDHRVLDHRVLDHEADHRIANNLGLIVGLLRLRARTVSQQTGKIDRAEVRVLLDDVAARVETVAQLHRMLSQSYQNALVDVGGYLRELCGSLTKSLSPDARVHVSYRTADTCVLPPDQVLTLGLLASELITNAVKYAHPTGLPVQIEVACRQAAGDLMIEISDDGIGLPEGFDPMVDGGLGLRVVRSLVAQLGASIRFDSTPLGTSVGLRMPSTGNLAA